MSINQANQNGHGAYCSVSGLLRERFNSRDLKLFAPHPVRSAQTGRFRTRFRGRGVDFEEVRLYQAGDDIRSIDWRVTARTQVPHTKLYSEERERPVYLLCDQRSCQFFGSVQHFKSTLACHIASCIGWAALSSGDRVGSLVFGDHDFHDSRPKRSKHAVLQMIHLLEQYNRALTSPISDAQSVSLAQILSDGRRIAKPGSALFVISDFSDLDSAAEKELFHMSRHLDVTLIQVFDPLERQLASRTALAISDGDQRKLLPVHQKNFQQAFESLAQRKQQQLTDVCTRLQIELLPISTADDYVKLLRQRFTASPRMARRR
ncbi:DUF58 domain-containing protein [Gilvimarinus sp. SDUM040013]|uniref:DUF58 domain-containing protein n=1 Tax=Gilvimarinus gilvus TaxID=3058038 RepID=A0ABU4RWZ2_9GAMM|nr:DUF58 domain-containing protein [Gilvimarinus sp. SDUM040013]MDO3385765.1 DUF58 domain-containing protein [Gilvimarinus sp. SDUM040013]MDX6849405.1 DUF58 domain-containing protein [Gilvimarinus sp. SDUM040013]